MKSLKSLAVATFATLSMPGLTLAENWDFGATTTNYNDPLNWNTNALPAPGNPINSTGFIQAQSPIITAATIPGGTITHPEIQVGVVNSGFFTVDSGIVNTPNFYVGMFTNGVGTVTQNGGTVSTTDLRVGFQNNAQGTYNLTGGTLSVTGDLSLVADGGQGTLNHGGGILDGTRLRIANFGTNKTGTMTVSASSEAHFDDGNIEIGLGGSGTNLGTLLLEGSRTGSGTNMTSTDLNLGNTGAFAANIDLAAIGTPLAMRALTLTGTANLQAGSLLDLGFSIGVTPTSGTWTIMTADGSINDNGIALASGDAAAGWSFLIDNSTPTSTLNVTYTVPEPSICVLMLAAAGASAIRRRRAACL